MTNTHTSVPTGFVTARCPVCERLTIVHPSTVDWRCEKCRHTFRELGFLLPCVTIVRELVDDSPPFTSGDDWDSIFASVREQWDVGTAADGGPLWVDPFAS